MIHDQLEPSSENDRRLNVLLIMGDEHATGATEIYGGPAITPNLATLASSGTVFDNAYCNAPLCVPSRSSMLTGMLASEVDVFDLASSLSSDIPTVAHAVRAAGYDAVLAGKMHFVGPDQLHGFRAQLSYDLHADESPLFVWPDEDERPLWPFPMEAGPGSSPHLEADDSAEQAAIRYIEEQAAEDRPWLLCASFISPHWPYVVPDEFYELYREDFDWPPHNPDEDPASQHPVIAHMRRVMGGNDYPQETISKARRAYLAAITHLDQRVGKLIAALKATRQFDNTVIIYVSDHGGMLGEHHLWRKMNFYEESVRVPLIVRHPKMAKVRRNRDLVSLLDLFPTICEIARAPLPSNLRGESLLAKMGQSETGDREVAALAEYLAQGVSQPMAMIRRGRYKYIYYHGYRPSLFDIENDPCEINDLGENPEFSAVRHELLQILLSQWDPEELDFKVRKSQQDRAMIRDALTSANEPENN